MLREVGRLTKAEQSMMHPVQVLCLKAGALNLAGYPWLAQANVRGDDVQTGDIVFYSYERDHHPAKTEEERA